MKNTEYVKLFFCQFDAAQHKAVSPQGLDGIDAHASHKFFDLVLPCGHKINQPLFTGFRVKSFYKLRTLSCNSPVTFTALAGTAEMAAKGKKGGGCYIAGICTQGNSLYYISSASDTSANYQ